MRYACPKREKRMPTLSEKDLKRLTAQLHRDEGSNKNKSGLHVAYLDTRNILTIGYGHNCAASPVAGVTKPGDTITDEQAEALFEQDLASHIWATRRALPWVENIDAVRQAVFYNMAFNLGVNGLLGFKSAIAHARVGDWLNAAKEMLKSAWAKQVKGRANRLAKQMETGVWQ